MTCNRLMALFVHVFSLFSIKYNSTIIYEKLLSEYLSCEFTSCFLATKLGAIRRFWCSVPRGGRGAVAAANVNLADAGDKEGEESTLST